MRYVAGEQRKNPEYARKEEVNVADKGYTGKIKNSGTQVVDAPHQNKGKGGQSKVIKGDDLRTGKGKK